MRLQNGTRDGIFMFYMWEKPKIKKLQIEENHTLFIGTFGWDDKT